LKKKNSAKKLTTVKPSWWSTVQQSKCLQCG